MQMWMSKTRACSLYSRDFQIGRVFVPLSLSSFTFSIRSWTIVMIKMGKQYREQALQKYGWCNEVGIPTLLTSFSFFNNTRISFNNTQIPIKLFIISLLNSRIQLENLCILVAAKTAHKIIISGPSPLCLFSSSYLYGLCSIYTVTRATERVTIL